MEILHEVARAYENKGDGCEEAEVKSFSIKGIEKSKRTAKELIIRNTKPKNWWEAHVLKHQPSGLRLWFLLLISSPFIIILVCGAVVFFVPWLLYLRCAKPRGFLDKGPVWLIEGLGLGHLVELKEEVGEDPKDEGTAKVIETKQDWPFPQGFDCHIYWYNDHHKCSKDFFDSKRSKTVIYVHGWEPDTTERGFRETVSHVESKHEPYNWLKTLLSINLWLEKGYNVGVFYWNQFSDEPRVTDAENKIYTTQGLKKMRWARQNSDGTVSHINNPAHQDRCVAQRLLEEYRKYLGTRSTAQSHVHIVGHSLGSQLTLEFFRRLVLQRPDCIYPSRITLLDPYFSFEKKNFAPFNGIRPAMRASQTLDMIREFDDNVLLETYETSGVNALVGETCMRLKTLTEYRVVDMLQFPWYYFAARHIAAPHVYFSSMYDDEEIPSRTPTNFFNPQLPVQLHFRSTSSSTSPTTTTATFIKHWHVFSPLNHLSIFVHNAQISD